MDACILPFELDVELKTYQSTAFPLGIMKANLRDYDIWLCNKFIQTTWYNEGNFSFVRDDNYSVEEGLTTKQDIIITPENLTAKGINILDFNRSMIARNHYILGQYNERFIPHKRAYQRYDFDHGYLIYGYDDHNGVFKSAGYLVNGRYSFFDIKYEDYFKSLVGCCVRFARIHPYRVQDNCSVTLNLPKIKKHLEDYLYSRWDNPDKLHCGYGVSTWDMLLNYVSLNTGDLDLRYGRLFMEHRALMYKRLQKLTELQYIEDASFAEEFNENVYKKAQIVFYLFIKHNVSHQKHLTSRILQYMTQVNCNERVLLKQIIPKIKLSSNI